MEKQAYTELSNENRFTLICVFVCWMVEALVGVDYFWNHQDKYSAVDAVLFFALMFIPWIIAVVIYRGRSGSPKIRKILYYSSIIFYGYICVSDKPVQFILVILPILISTIVYCDLIIMRLFTIGTIICGCIGMFIRWGRFSEDPQYMFGFFASASFVITATFLMSGMAILQKKQDKKTNAINKERDRFQAIVSVGVEKIFEYNIKDDIIMVSESDSGVYGKERYLCNFSTIAKNKNYIPFTDWYRFDELLFACKSGMGIVENELRVRDDILGENRWYHIKARLIFDDEGQPDKLIGTMKDIEDEKRLEMRLADEKMRDPVTKVYKKNYLIQFVDEHLAKEKGDKTALIILDVDGYKKINEEMGVVFGDEILKNIAQDIKQLLDANDLVGRDGNDEFVIFMKDIESVSKIEDKIRLIQKTIANTYTGEREKKNCTVSIGATVCDNPEDRFENLYERAEKALNLAQSKGPSHYDIYNKVKENVYGVLANELAQRKSRLAEEERRKGTASNSITELAFKLIDESKDTDSAINLLIRQICRQLDLSAIVIKTKIQDTNAMKIMYSYGVEELETQDLYRVDYNDEEWKAMLALYDKDDIAVCSSINEVDNDYLKGFLLAMGIESFAGCPFYERGVFAGTIDFLDFEKERIWSDEEIKDIKSITNVVSSYLLKMKAYEDASETVERLTGYDALTGLYKYEKFLKLAGDYIATAEHGNYAIAYMDMFHFKYLNDTYGYEVGDQVLAQMAEMLIGYPEYVVMGSRVFSDNIVALLKLRDYERDAIEKRIEIAIKEFSDVIRQRFSDSRLDIGVGICTFTISGGPVMLQSIISNANMARKRTKIPEMPNCIFYDEQMGSAAKNEIAYANDMETAVKNREFVVYMQPKVNLKNNKIEGAEALVRWRKEDGSIIYPNDFIPIFERNKSVTLLDFYVYEEVCRYIRERLDAGLPAVNVSVNVSRVHLYAIDAIIDKIASLIKKYNVPPHMLEFELTETSFTDKVDDTIRLMSKLRELGAKVSMDDFGSGYSSLNVLTKLPLDVLKIDKEFLRDFETDSEEKIVIPSVIAMAKKLKLDVVCEGVETIEQVEFLREINCDYAQGYYYSKPVPQEEFNKLLDKRQA